MIFLTYLPTNLRKTIVVAIKCKEKGVGKKIGSNLVVVTTYFDDAWLLKEERIVEIGRTSVNV